MDGDRAPKKISFGFTKQIKKSVPLSVKPQEKIQLIDCLEGKSIKLKEGEEIEDKGPLIIPLKEKDKTITAAALTNLAKIDNSKSQLPDSNKAVIPEDESLDAKAARELLEEAQKSKSLEANVNSFVVPMNEPDTTIGTESTLEDYEKIPVNDFGMAMLRGMGWKEGQGIGKHNKNVDIAPPKLRPKGLGLGADKVAMISSQGDKGSKAENEEKVEIIKGAYIKITAGKHKDAYGQILGFDDGGMRTIVKLAINGVNINVNEVMLQAVTKDEYHKKSKVLNAAKYDEFVSKNLNKIDINNLKHSNVKTEESRTKKGSSDERSQSHSSGDNRMQWDSRKYRSEDKSVSSRYHRSQSTDSSDSDRTSERKQYSSRSRDSDKKRKGKKKRRDRSRSRDRRRH